mmetsp:Transcript_115774/g.327444  ORF Transcript_115774/g.327444 Transcript_115774/m.327444 type:complete len:204 (+) Transcript_115774:571-1182(+)
MTTASFAFIDASSAAMVSTSASSNAMRPTHVSECAGTAPDTAASCLRMESRTSSSVDALHGAPESAPRSPRAVPSPSAPTTWSANTLLSSRFRLWASRCSCQWAQCFFSSKHRSWSFAVVSDFSSILPMSRILAVVTTPTRASAALSLFSLMARIRSTTSRLWVHTKRHSSSDCCNRAALPGRSSALGPAVGSAGHCFVARAE